MSKLLTGNELMELVEQENDYLVEGLVPKGVVIIGGAPKLGKTAFVMQMVNKIGYNRNFLDRKVNSGSSLYIAFEDTAINFKQRYKMFGEDAHNDIKFIFVNNTNNFSLRNTIDKACNAVTNLKVVVVDTFVNIRSENEVKYSIDYQEVSSIHKLAFEKDITIILITHLVKTVNKHNPFDNIYGSRGISGGADGIIVLLSDNPESNIIQCHVTGKVIQNQTILLKRNDNLVFELFEDQQIIETHDENILKVMNHVISVKEFVGTHSQLCSKLGLMITGKKLSVLIKQNIVFLASNYIEYESLDRTSSERLMKLIYVGLDDGVTVE